MPIPENDIRFLDRMAEEFIHPTEPTWSKMAARGNLVLIVVEPRGAHIFELLKALRWHGQKCVELTPDWVSAMASASAPEVSEWFLDGPTPEGAKLVLLIGEHVFLVNHQAGEGLSYGVPRQAARRSSRRGRRSVRTDQAMSRARRGLLEGDRKKRQ